MLLETIRIEGGEAQHLSWHTARLNRCRRRLFGSSDELDLASLLAPPSDGLYRCRVLCDTELRRIEYLPYRPRTIQHIALIESDIEYACKYADRSHFDALHRHFPECDDLLILKEGLLTDTTIANVALLKEGRWLTPDRPLLEGTTRARLIEEGFVTPARLQKEDLLHCDGFALMNAMLGFSPIQPIWLHTETRK
jgi:4-amino-4-deoxychorismate lyase